MGGAETTVATGAIIMTASIGRPKPSYIPPTPPEQQAPVLQLRFEQPLTELAEVIGEPKTTDGVHGQALDLRSGGLLKLPSDRAHADFDGPFTILLSAKPEAWERDREMPVLLSKGEWQGPGWFIQLYRGKLRVSLGGEQILDAGTLESGRWRRLAVVYDGEDARLYLDGEEIGLLEGAAPPEASDRPLLIGAYHEPGQREEFPFRGYLGDIQLYRRALTEEEIEADARDHPSQGPSSSG